MRITISTPTELILEHRPRWVPFLCALMVVGGIGKVIQTAASLSPDQWIGYVLGISTAAGLAYFSSLPSRAVFDAIQQEVRWQHIGWPGAGKGRCSFAELRGVDILGDSPSTGPDPLVLKTTSGQVQLVRGVYGSDPNQKIAAEITEWLAKYQQQRPAA